MVLADDVMSEFLANKLFIMVEFSQWDSYAQTYVVIVKNIFLSLYYLRRANIVEYIIWAIGIHVSSIARTGFNSTIIPKIETWYIKWIIIQTIYFDWAKSVEKNSNDSRRISQP